MSPAIWTRRSTTSETPSSRRTIFTIQAISVFDNDGDGNGDTLAIDTLANQSADVTIRFSAGFANMPTAPDGANEYVADTPHVLQTKAAVVFNAKGNPTVFNTAQVEILGFANGAADIDGGTGNPDRITLDFGTIGDSNGLTQFAAPFTPGSIQQNGARFGVFSRVDIDKDGLVTAVFDNGETRPIYKLPITTFTNVNELNSRTGNVWNATSASGDPTLREAVTARRVRSLRLPWNSPPSTSARVHQHDRHSTGLLGRRQDYHHLRRNVGGAGADPLADGALAPCRILLNPWTLVAIRSRAKPFRNAKRLLEAFQLSIQGLTYRQTSGGEIIMTETYDLILRGGVCATPSGIVETDVAVKNGAIAAIGDIGNARTAEVVDVSGLHVLPGVIDSQVHFREPGLEYKEDFATGTAAAALGGVTGVFEMPNTNPLTLNPEAIADKCRRAKDRAWVNMAFFIGAAAENAEKLGEWENLPGCSGVKIFMGSSTGSLLVPDDDTLRVVLANSNRRCSVHCEDESRLRERFSLVADGADVSMHPEWRDVETAARATTRLLRLARPLRRRVHVLHVTTAEEMEILKDYRDIATVECTPQHLTLAAPECYETLGAFAQMNPPIREARHREALWKAVDQGLVDVLGSDHAPHTKEEKANPYPKSPSGMPGVQTLVPIMLNHVAEGRLTLSDLSI